uniref:Phosphatase and actin regulator n=1 Tax=Knipowitschia caucasica TaxID=637954 RepID=A0AAV2KGW7_KNICA
MESAPFRTQPIRRDAEGKAARFELERRACQSLRKVLQLKLEQRRTREELVNQGIIPPLKSSTSFHEQKRSLERARTEDYLKRKIKRRPHRTELIRMNILEGVIPEEAELEKRARLTDDLNNKISQRPGPMELIHKNILPVHASIKSAFTETYRQKFRTVTIPAGENPAETYHRLKGLYRRWIRPEQHTKEQIGEQIILEQLLRVFPADIRTWVKEHDRGPSGG